jgi:hypothetical protein
MTVIGNALQVIANLIHVCSAIYVIRVVAKRSVKLTCSRFYSAKRRRNSGLKDYNSTTYLERISQVL